MADRSYVAGNFMFELQGVKCGFIKSVEGGAISAEVINESVGPDYFVKKHIGQPKYEDFTMQIGFSMTKAVYEWIQASWKQNYMRKDGAIIAADFNLNAKSQRDFFHALITETTVPACDGSSKDPAYMTLKFAPEYTRYKKASGKVQGEINSLNQKMWLPSNFRLEIAGLDCTRVNKIEALTIKQTAVTDDIGDARDMAKEPGKLEFPPLKLELAEVTAQSWMDYFDTFVIKGNNEETQEKNGSLIFLSSNREKELARLNFFNMGIYKLTPAKSEANDDKIKRISVELYCERIEFAYGAHTTS
jgi:hypothetical protein